MPERRALCGRCCSAWDDKWRMRWQSQQHGLERYNCADSLDRTNAASYFGAVQVTAELSSVLCWGLAAEHAGTLHSMQQTGLTHGP